MVFLHYILKQASRRRVVVVSNQSTCPSSINLQIFIFQVGWIDGLTWMKAKKKMADDGDDDDDR